MSTNNVSPQSAAQQTGEYLERLSNGINRDREAAGRATELRREKKASMQAKVEAIRALAQALDEDEQETANALSELMGIHDRPVRIGAKPMEAVSPVIGFVESDYTSEREAA